MFILIGCVLGLISSTIWTLYIGKEKDRWADLTDDDIWVNGCFASLFSAMTCSSIGFGGAFVCILFLGRQSGIGSLFMTTGISGAIFSLLLLVVSAIASVIGMFQIADDILSRKDTA